MELMMSTTIGTEPTTSVARRLLDLLAAAQLDADAAGR
jgi:hypothetical protein